MSYNAQRTSLKSMKRDVTHPWRSRRGCRAMIQITPT